MTDNRLTVIAHIMVEIIHTMNECGDSYEEQIEAIRDRLHLAIKESSEEKDEVISRLSLATDSDSIVGACDCLTKSPDIHHHKKGCKYRLIVERDDARAEAFAAFKANRYI